MALFISRPIDNKPRTDLTATYAYDGLGRRVQKQVSDSGRPKTTDYLYSGFSFSPTVTTDNPGKQVTHLYYGASGLAESRDIRPGGRGQAWYHQPNWRGDTALLTNQSGHSTHEYFYTSYGELLDNNSQLQDSSNFTGPHNRFTLSGKELDAESGLTYFGVRHYDAARGNWTTADPFRGPLNDPLQRNRYLFNRGNPMRYVDPVGAETYTVQPGDTLWDISARFQGSGADWPAIHALNMFITNPDMIFPGQVLYLWGSGSGSGGGDGSGGAYPPPPPPPPLSNATMLCNNSLTPASLSSWCDSVLNDGVVPPLPDDFAEQIMNSDYAQWVYSMPTPPVSPSVPKDALMLCGEYCDFHASSIVSGNQGNPYGDIRPNSGAPCIEYCGFVWDDYLKEQQAQWAPQQAVNPYGDVRPNSGAPCIEYCGFVWDDYMKKRQALRAEIATWTDNILNPSGGPPLQHPIPIVGLVPPTPMGFDHVLDPSGGGSLFASPRPVGIGPDFASPAYRTPCQTSFCKFENWMNTYGNLFPTHMGYRGELQVSFNLGIGVQFYLGVNKVRNRISHETGQSVDFGMVVSFGGEAKLITGNGQFLFGWNSTDVEQITTGNTGVNVGADAGAGLGGTLNVNWAGEEDPVYGKRPITISFGPVLGLGAGASVGGGTGETQIYKTGEQLWQGEGRHGIVEKPVLFFLNLPQNVINWVSDKFES